MLGYLMGWVGPSGFGSSSTADDIASKYAEQIDGRVFIVTGSNSGIGLETVVQLCKRGATVVMACRNPTKASEAQNIVQSACAGSDCKLHLLSLDLSSLSSVEAFVNDFHALNLPLHCLINNAGVMACPLAHTVDGHELQFGTNHLGHFKLTNLLAEDLRKSAPSRVINVSSIAYTFPYREGIRFTDLNGETSYNKWSAYGQSKLANVLHARELQQRFRALCIDVSSFSVHPGVIYTDLYRHIAGIGGVIMYLSSFVLKNVGQGAATTLYCALAPEASEHGGGFFMDANYVSEERMTPHSRDSELARKLWEVCAMFRKREAQMMGIFECSGFGGIDRQ